MLGQALQDDIAMTAAPTAIAPVPILPTQVDVYLDDTSAGIGTTKLTRVLEATLEIADRYGTLWALNSAVSGFAAHVETEPKATLRLMLEADDTGMGPLAAMRAGSKKFIRLVATGAEIAAPYNYLFQADLCGVVSEVSDFSDQDGVYAVEWTFQATYDSAWGAGKALQIEVINTLADL